MNNFKQIFLTVLITSLVVGYAVNYWHSNNFEIVRVDSVENVNGITVNNVDDFKENQDVTNEIKEQNNEELDSGKSESDQNNEIEVISSQFKTYQNSKDGYEVSYPIGWEYQEALSDSYNSTLFGLPSSKYGGYTWGIKVIDSDQLESEIQLTGRQFDDREEIRGNVVLQNGLEALMVTVSTQKVPDWIHKAIFIESNDQIYVISNGASDVDGFEDFYNSFKFTD